MKALFMSLLVLCSGICVAQTWLSLPANTGYFDIGDLDISGSQLTVEAIYTSTDPASVDLVSKHSNPGDVNYLLRSTHAELTTTGGFQFIPNFGRLCLLKSPPQIL